MKDWLSFTQQKLGVEANSNKTDYVQRISLKSRTHPKIGQTLPWIKTKCRGMVVGNVSHTPELRFYWSLCSIISRAWFTHFPSPALLCV